MSAKLNSHDGVKGFFVKHGEKLAFGVCVVCVVGLIMSGKGVKGLTDTDTPDALKNQLESSKLRINRSTWEEVKEWRTPDYELVAKVEAGRRPTDATLYSFQPVRPTKAQELRADPELLAPSKPLAHGMTVALLIPDVVRGRTMRSQLDELKIATVEKEEKKPKPKPRRPRRPRGSSSEEEFYEDYEEEMEETEVDTPPEPRRLTQALYSRIPGIKPIGRGVPQGRSIVIGTATVPVEKQWQAYKFALSDAAGYDPMRDRPLYRRVLVERQDVTDNPDFAVVDDAWKQISSSDTYLLRYLGIWQPFPDPVDPLYYHPQLSLPIPLILNRDFGDSVLHPDTPPRMVLNESESTDPADSGDERDPLEFRSPLDAPMRTDTADPMSPPSGGPGSSFGEGSEYAEQSDFDPVTGPAKPFKLIRFVDLEAKQGRVYRYRVRVELYDVNNPIRQNDFASEQGGEFESEGYSGTSNLPQLRPGGVKYDASSGTSEGVSFSSASSSYSGSESSSGTALLPALLQSSVRSRVKKIRAQLDEMIRLDPAQDKTMNDLNMRRENKFLVATPWSEASEPIVVPGGPEKVLAGVATAPKLARSEPSGKIVTSVWSPRYSVTVPVEREVKLGSVLNFTSQADVLDPCKGRVLRIEEFDFKTDDIVVDIQGGDSLPGGDKKEPFTVAGEFLILNENGQLTGRNELDDMDQYRLEMLIPDDEELPEESEGAFGDGYESYDDVPGAEPGSSRSRRNRRNPYDS